MCLHVLIGLSKAPPGCKRFELNVSLCCSSDTIIVIRYLRKSTVSTKLA